MSEIAPETVTTNLDERKVQRSEATAKINEVRATLRAQRAQRTAAADAGCTAGPSRSARAERKQDRASLKDESWSTVERYITTSLNGIEDDSVALDAATKAAESIETDGLAMGSIGTGQWSTSDVTRVHGARIRLIKLLLGLREAQGEDRIPDAVFLERWVRTAKIFKYHDEHWVMERRKNKETPLVSLAFPDDGTLTMFDLGRRVWRGVR